MNQLTRVLLFVAAIDITVVLLLRRCSIENGINWGDAPTWLAAVGGLLVVVVAIWGDEVKAALAGPKLTIALADAAGEPIPINNQPGRYFHVRVSNGRPWSPAVNTRVMLLRTEIINDGATHVVPMAGPLWLEWRYEAAIPGRSELTLRREDFGDLFLVCMSMPAYINDRPRPTLQVALKVRPSNYLATYSIPIHMRLYVQAQADNGESNVLGIDADWDGQWYTDPDTDLRNHLKISVFDIASSQAGADVWRYQR
jgi:hypothetical protein